MDYLEFLELGRVKEEPKVITVAELTDKTPRVLLDGYDTDRNDHIVELGWDQQIEIRTVHGSRLAERNSDFLPNKRLYPEHCDYEFCKLLKEAGEYLPFTTWNGPIKDTGEGENFS